MKVMENNLKDEFGIECKLCKSKFIFSVKDAEMDDSFPHIECPVCEHNILLSRNLDNYREVYEKFTSELVVYSEYNPMTHQVVRSFGTKQKDSIDEQPPYYDTANNVARIENVTKEKDI